MRSFLRHLVLSGAVALTPATASVAAAPVGMVPRPQPAWPLHTKSRYIVDREGRRFKLAAVNWYGANDVRLVPGGLDTAPLGDIIAAVHASGFNSVRLPFANVMLHTDTAVDPDSVRANPAYLGKRPLEVFDAVVAALTQSGIAVILNNHSTHAMWCCSYDDDGLWYTRDYDEEHWLADWLFLAQRYRDNPGVVGVDLRNEVRIAKFNGTVLPVWPTWGDGANDWRSAAERAGNRILQVNPQLLIVVEGINFPRYHLRGVYLNPVRLQVPDHLVYGAHNYGYLGPELLGPRYGDMDEATLAAKLGEEWAFVTRENQSYTAPIWVSEFGDDMSGALTGRDWFQRFTRYLASNDFDFAYWALNAGPKASGEPESFAWLTRDWRLPLADWRSEALAPLLTVHKGPGVEAGWDEDPAHHFEVLLLADSDTNLSQDRADWLPGSRKATCRDASRAVGVSGGEREGWRFSHALLCSDYALPLQPATSAVVAASGGDGGGYGEHPSDGDWSPWHQKLECQGDAYVSGMAQQHTGRSYHITGVRCTRSPGLQARACHGLDLAGGDVRRTAIPEDWDPQLRKGQCALNEYIAGISIKDGVLRGLLCCAQ